MRFTNNPYEGFMKEKSYFKGVPPSLPPKGSRCDGCPYWRGIGCVFCYREQLPSGATALPHTGQALKSGLGPSVSSAASSAGSRGRTASRK